MKYILIATGQNGTSTLLRVPDEIMVNALQGIRTPISRCLPKGLTEFPYVTVPFPENNHVLLSIYNVNWSVTRHPVFVKDATILFGSRVATAELTQQTSARLTQGECVGKIPMYIATMTSPPTSPSRHFA